MVYHLLFIKSFWNLLKPFVLQILNGFALDMLDIFLLNFGVISLITKIHGADWIM
jgi:hypothetical protein